MNLDGLELSILGPAMLAGILVLATHVPLGREVLARGIIFIDLAVAQISSLGVIAADRMDLHLGGFGVELAAGTAAVSGALILTWTERHFAEIQEALIGILFVLAATGSILLLAENPHGGDYLKDLLVGQILWTTWQMLIPIAVLYAVLLLVWFTSREKIGHAGFYITFAFAVTAAVQIVGVYLVFASLILPALATRRMHGVPRLWAGYTVGTLSYLAGIVISALLDLPTGAVTVWTMAVFALIAGLAIGASSRS